MGQRPPMLVLTPAALVLVVALPALVVDLKLALVFHFRQVPGRAYPFVPHIFYFINFLVYFLFNSCLLRWGWELHLGGHQLVWVRISPITLLKSYPRTTRTYSTLSVDQTEPCGQQGLESCRRSVWKKHDQT